MSAWDRIGPLTERPFRLLWLGRTGSSVGDALIPVALAFGVLRIGGGATGLGIVLAAFTIGRATFIVAGGVWADRLPRREVMIGADAVRFSTQAATAGLFLTGTAHVWQLALFQGIAGAAGGFFNPASTALVPRTISAPRLQQANALLSISQSATNIFGPALSGVIVAFSGAGTVFAIDAASFLFSIACLAALRVDDPRREERSRFWNDVMDGYREVRRVRWLTAGFLGFALGNVGIGIFFVLGPLIARQHLGGAAAWGAIVSAGAVGGLVGGLTSYRIRPSRPVATAFAIWAIGSLPAFALIRPFPLVAVMAANVVFGLGIVVGNTLWETSMQQEVQPDKLARVGSIDWLLSLCLMPVGQAIAGPLVAAFGVRAIILAAGLLMSVPSLCVVTFVREVRDFRRVPRRDPAAVGEIAL